MDLGFFLGIFFSTLVMEMSFSLCSVGVQGSLSMFLLSNSGRLGWCVFSRIGVVSPESSCSYYRVEMASFPVSYLLQREPIMS